MQNFIVENTENTVIIRSKSDSAFSYRLRPINGMGIARLQKLVAKNAERMKLIPFMKAVDKHVDIQVETRTTKNGITGKYLWVAGYQQCPECPRGTLGGLDYAGSTFTGEWTEGGRPINFGRNCNNQNAGALKGMKTVREIEEAENRPKFTESERNCLRAAAIRAGKF